MNLLRKSMALPPHELLLVLEAASCLGLARLCMVILPFRWIARCVGTHMFETLHTGLPRGQAAAVWGIRRRIDSTSRHVSWDGSCLSKSLAVKVMLAWRGIPSTLYIGVRKSSESPNGFQAHAWVRAGVIEVTPRGASGTFTIIALFA